MQNLTLRTRPRFPKRKQLIFLKHRYQQCRRNRKKNLLGRILAVHHDSFVTKEPHVSELEKSRASINPVINHSPLSKSSSGSQPGNCEIDGNTIKGPDHLCSGLRHPIPGNAAKCLYKLGLPCFIFLFPHFCFTPRLNLQKI